MATTLASVKVVVPPRSGRSTLTPARSATPSHRRRTSHNAYPLEGTLETVRWEAEAVGACWAPHHALVCVHGAHVHGGGLNAQGVAIVPASPLRRGLGCDRLLSDADVELLATAWTRLHPAA